MSDRLLVGMSLTEAVLVAQAVASGAMCGLIWFVQVVHYPLFAAIGGDRSSDYAHENQRRTTPVVLPFMLVEVVTAMTIAVWPPQGIPPWLAAVGFALVAIIWGSTFLLQVPLHGRLARDGHASDVVAALVRGNWIRTVAWTARAVLAAWMLRAAG